MRKDVAASNKTSIFLEWDKVANQEVETTGYLLWMAANSKGSDTFVLVMNGTSRPERTEFLVKGL